MSGGAGGLDNSAEEGGTSGVHFPLQLHVIFSVHVEEDVEMHGVCVAPSGSKPMHEENGGVLPYVIHPSSTLLENPTVFVFQSVAKGSDDGINRSVTSLAGVDVIRKADMIVGNNGGLSSVLSSKRRK
ncbi:hypothetical protein ACOSQ2_019601 [Xanthoceras sorbifolium]